MKYTCKQKLKLIITEADCKDYCQIVGCIKRRVTFAQRTLWVSSLDVNLGMYIENRLLAGSESIKMRHLYTHLYIHV